MRRSPNLKLYRILSPLDTPTDQARSLPRQQSPFIIRTMIVHVLTQRHTQNIRKALMHANARYHGISLSTINRYFKAFQRTKLGGTLLAKRETRRASELRFACIPRWMLPLPTDAAPFCAPCSPSSIKSKRRKALGSTMTGPART